MSNSIKQFQMHKKTLILIAIFVTCCLGVKAQDTLYFKNAGKLVVLVKEISQTEIQYKKFEVPDGPMYIININDIEKICYKNGFVETLKPSANTTNSTNESFVVTNNQEPGNLVLEKIEYRDAKRRYSSLVSLIQKHPDVQRRNTLTEMAISMKKLGKHQKGTRTLAVIFGSVAMAGAGLYVLMDNDYDDDIFAGPPILWGSLALVSTAACITVSINLSHKRKAFVKLYNE